MSTSIKLYVILCSIFCTIIVTGNLIFQKFIILDLFSQSFEISVGVFLYPITFLISDLVTEFYGKKNAELMIRTGVICSLVVLCLITIADLLPATDWSVVDDNTFHQVFNAYGVASFASIIANYIGQLIDIHIFSHIKTLTNGKHLWIRNNVSTIVGQFVDTITVVSILSIFSIIPVGQFFIVIYGSLAFKILAALLDTPLYLGHYFMRKVEFTSVIHPYPVTKLSN